MRMATPPSSLRPVRAIPLSHRAAPRLESPQFGIAPSRCPPAASMILTRDHSVGENVVYVDCYAANLRPGGKISMHGHGSPYVVEGLGALEPGSRQRRLGVDMGITLSTPLTADAAAGLAVNLVYQHNKPECSTCSKTRDYNNDLACVGWCNQETCVRDDKLCDGCTFCAPIRVRQPRSMQQTGG